MRSVIIICLLWCSTPLCSQTLGGNSVFNFLKLSNTPQRTALGGINITQPSVDVGLAFHNPALLSDSMHTQLNAVFNHYYAGIRAYHLSMAYRYEPWKTNFAAGLHYFNYGNTIQTDAAGNELGQFNPMDWVLQVTASRKYLERWQYGATLKFIHSGYGPYRSNGIAADVGVLFKDSSGLFSASILATNMGFQLKKYQGTLADDLPFDLQVGMTKRLANAPFSFSITAHHLQRFNINYNDTAFNNANGWDNDNKKFSLNKLFQHLVAGMTIYVGDRIEVQAGYNYLRRKELSIGKEGNGLNGFSMGLGVLLNKLTIRYARTNYQNNTAFNQLGLNLRLNQYFGLGKWGERIGW